MPRRRGPADLPRFPSLRALSLLFGERLASHSSAFLGPSPERVLFCRGGIATGSPAASPEDLRSLGSSSPPRFSSGEPEFLLSRGLASGLLGDTLLRGAHKLALPWAGCPWKCKSPQRSLCPRI